MKLSHSARLFNYDIHTIIHRVHPVSAGSPARDPAPYSARKNAGSSLRDPAETEGSSSRDPAETENY